MSNFLFYIWHAKFWTCTFNDGGINFSFAQNSLFIFAFSNSIDSYQKASKFKVQRLKLTLANVAVIVGGNIRTGKFTIFGSAALISRMDTSEIFFIVFNVFSKVHNYFYSELVFMVIILTRADVQLTAIHRLMFSPQTVLQFSIKK